MRRSACLTLVVLVLGGPPAGAAAAAPSRIQAADGFDAASPSLPPTHWAVRAAGRLEALGLAPGYFPAQRSVPRLEVAAALRVGAERARGEANPAAALAQAWHERFLEEFPETRVETARARGWGGAIRGGWAGSTGSSATALAPPATRPVLGAPPREDALSFRGSISGYPRREIAVLLEPELDAESLRMRAGDLVLGWGAASLSVGRGAVRYGPGESGGVVLSGLVPLDRLQLQTSRPLRLPWLLARLGPVTAHSFLARISEDPKGNPLLLGTSGQMRPHARLTLTFSRGILIGGDSTDAGSIPAALAGLANAGENQVYSAAFRYRLPTERALPLTVYGEWGTDDNPGALNEAPGLLVGLSIAALPTLPQVQIGVERAFLGVRCCRSLDWYTHGPLAWTAGGRPLGHPIGGNGSETLAYARADLLEARLRLNARAHLRERAKENLYAPGRAGESTGFAASAECRLFGRGDLRADLSRETGEGWSEREARVELSLFF